MDKIDFKSDYTRGAHPKVLERLVQTNMESTPGYGADGYCFKAAEKILQECGCETGKVIFLSGGTQTNKLMVDAMLSQVEGVMCTPEAHINVHEAGAIEATGHKVLTIESVDGKLDAEAVDKYMTQFYADDTWPHMVIPGMVYISQPTELGTLYSLIELKRLREVCDKWKLKLYADGARLVYGLASPANNVSLKDMAEIFDSFYIGGTKAGLLFGEAVVIPRPEFFPHIFTLVKRHGSMLAKGRLLGLQFDTMFTDDLYKEMGQNAIAAAISIRKAFVDKGWSPLSESYTNQQIFYLPNSAVEWLASVADFEIWGTPGKDVTAVRFVTDWATTDGDVKALLDALKVSGSESLGMVEPA